MLAYVDTNIFIRAIEGTKEFAHPSRMLLEFLRSRRGLAVTSELTLAEVLCPPQRPDALPLHLKRRVYLDLIVWSGAFDLIEVSRDILYGTADLRAVKNLRLLDAIHLVSAIRRSCRYFVSADNDFRTISETMTHVKPVQADIEQLLSDLA